MKVALLTPDLRVAGGVAVLARQVLRSLDLVAPTLAPDIITVATSSRDEASSQLRHPGTWNRGGGVQQLSVDGLTVSHYGCSWTELETSRYRTSSRLHARLSSFDVVQVVAGTPAWALLVPGSTPSALLFASTAHRERANRWRQANVTDMWRRGMTRRVRTLDSKALRHAGHVDVLNDEMAAHVRAVRGDSHVHVLVPGVDLETFKPRTHQTRRYILAVARHDDARKNLPLLLRCFAAALDAGLVPGLRLHLAGPAGPSRSDLQLGRELGIAHSVDVETGVSRERLAQLYDGAVATCLLSKEEGLGLVLLEALASGCPVIATDTSGARMTIRNGENGFLLSSQATTEDFLKALRCLTSSDEHAASFRHRARHHAEREFGEGGLAEHLSDSWKALTGT